MTTPQERSSGKEAREYREARERGNRINSAMNPADSATSWSTGSNPALSASSGLLVGQRLGSYRLDALLAVGGMAEVYRARDLDLWREVAVKVRSSRLANSDRYAAQFRDEARRMAQLMNPHIVPVYHVGEADVCGNHMLYMVMPLLHTSLHERLRLEGRLPWSEAVHLALDVAEGLRAVHAARLVHCDVKPGNILLDANGRALLADFGISLNAAPAAREQRTSEANPSQELVAGTPAYMAPEQLRGLDVDGRADVYGLGAVLYQMLTGRLPFGGDTPLELAWGALHDPIIRPSALVPEGELPAGLDRVVLTALARDRHRRFGTIGDFAQALRAVMAHHETVHDQALATLPFHLPTIPAISAVLASTQQAYAAPASAAKKRVVVVAMMVFLAAAAGLTSMAPFQGKADSLIRRGSESIGARAAEADSQTASISTSATPAGNPDNGGQPPSQTSTLDGFVLSPVSPVKVSPGKKLGHGPKAHGNPHPPHLPHSPHSGKSDHPHG